MSKNYTFTPDLTSTIGVATKKTLMDKAAANTDEINQRLEGLALLGDFMPLAGGGAINRDGNGRISSIDYTTSPVGTLTVHRDGNDRIDWVQIALTDPVVRTIKITVSRDENDKISAFARTIT